MLASMSRSCVSRKICYHIIKNHKAASVCYKNIFISFFSILLSVPASFSLACYVNFKEKDLTRYTGVREYYVEYRALKFKTKEGKCVSFDINDCDPLPLMRLEHVRWFFSSAIEGNHPEYGVALAVRDSSISHVFVIRGKTMHGWSQIYCGYDANHPISSTNKGKKKIYAGNVLYVYNKDYSNIDHIRSYLIGVNYLTDRIKVQDTGELVLDVRKEPTQVPQWRTIEPKHLLPRINSPVYLPTLSLRIAIGISATVYWKDELNRLKDIRYRKVSGQSVCY